MKVWILTNSPSPYQMEFFRALQAADGIDIDVRFMQAEHRGQNPLRGTDPGFPFECLRPVGRASRPAERRFHPQAVREVCRGAHDVYVLSGHYTSSTFLFCALCLWLHRRWWTVWLERPWPDDDRPAWATKRSAKSGCIRWIRRRALSRLLHMTRGVFGIGTVAVDAYRALGAAPEKVFNLPYLCDINRFATVLPERVEHVRARHGMHDRFVFLFSGALTIRKGTDTLLRAFMRLATETDRADLLILGDGEQRLQLEAMVDEPVRARVHFAGHVSQADLPAYFAAADVFVFPSRYDGWGVVLNEACAAGLPVITTRQTGAALDLVRDGENGFVLDRDDVDGFYQKMRFLEQHPAAVRSFGQRSRAIVGGYDLGNGVRRFRAAVEACLQGRERRP
jgi:glycosyltransferase involved in cell wall biosynthesis